MRTIDVIGKGTWVCRTEGRNTQSYSLFVSTLLCRDKLLTDSPYKQRIPAVDVSLHANTAPAELMTVSVIVGAWRYSGPRATQSPFGITPSPNYHFKKGLYLMVLFFFFFMMASNSTHVTLLRCMSSVYGVCYKTLSRNHNVPWLHHPQHWSTASRTSPRSFREILPSCWLPKTLVFYSVNELNRGQCSGVRNAFLRSGMCLLVGGCYY